MLVASCACISAEDNVSDQLGVTSNDDVSADEESDGGITGDESIDIDVTVDEDDDSDVAVNNTSVKNKPDDVMVSLQDYATGNPVFLVLIMFIAILLPFRRHI